MRGTELAACLVVEQEENALGVGTRKREVDDAPQNFVRRQGADERAADVRKQLQQPSPVDVRHRALGIHAGPGLRHMLNLGVALDEHDWLHRDRTDGQEGLAKGEAIAVAQVLLFDLLAVHERAVAATEIRNRALVLGHHETGVPA